MSFITATRLTWYRVQSSNLDAVAYDRASLTLYIAFKGNRTYRYDGVPPSVFSQLMEAESKGRYFYYNIRGRYPYERIG